MAGSTLRVLIVGGGVAGLALARALRLAGFRPDVIEERPAAPMPGHGTHHPGPGLFLLANAERALRTLDLDSPLRPLGQVIGAQRFLDSTGTPLCAVDLAALWGTVGQCRALLRAELHQVLFTGVGGEVRHGVGVRKLDLATDRVGVTFDDDRQDEYDLVVGADGRTSTIRSLAALGGAPRPTGQLIHHFVVNGGPRIDDWIHVLGDRAGFVVMPIGAGRLYCHADVSAEAYATDPYATDLYPPGRYSAGSYPAGSYPAGSYPAGPYPAGSGSTPGRQPDGPRPAGRADHDDTCQPGPTSHRNGVADQSADPGALDRLRGIFADYGGPVPAVLDAAEHIWVTPSTEVELGCWSRNRVVLIGDAAHATSPTLAQGAALAIEDAVVLAAELRRAPTVAQALSGYESRRRPRTKWVLDRTRDRDRTRDVPPALRDPLLRSRGGRIFREHYRLLLDPA